MSVKQKIDAGSNYFARNLSKIQFIQVKKTYSSSSNPSINKRVKIKRVDRRNYGKSQSESKLQNFANRIKKGKVKVVRKLSSIIEEEGSELNKSKFDSSFIEEELKFKSLNIVKE
jgi:hypothetical protein